MIATLAPRFTKLPPAQRRLWPRLRPAVSLEFVLYGGTAISLHLGHRRSVDFDFFHDRPLDSCLVHVFKAVWPERLAEELEQVVRELRERAAPGLAWPTSEEEEPAAP